MLENIEAQNQNNDRLRQIRHDLKNHLVTVRYLVEQNQRSQCLEYIDRLTDDYTSSRLVIRTGNAVLDNVISVKLNTAVEHDIMVSVTADFSCLRSLSDVDICVIFANLLDNAIEACDRIEKAEDRYIDIRSAVQGGQCIFTIQNSYNGCCICDHDEFQTTKPDQLCHGIGIKSVRAAMERSGGILHFEQDEDELIFKTVLIFPEPRFGLN